MHARGFTLIEFAVVMAIVGILVSLAVPSIVSFTANSEVRSTASSIVGDIGLARAEALRTRGAVTMCARSGSTCGTDWTQGWIIFVDTNGNQTLDAGERVIRNQEALGGRATLTGPAAFLFRSTGAVAISGTLQLRRDLVDGRDIQVIQGGRVTSTVVPLP